MAEDDQNRRGETAAEREKAIEQELERIDEDDESEQLERVDGGEQSERAGTEGEYYYQFKP
jgi:hypothetical protein